MLNNIGAYKTSFNLSNSVWEIIVKWDNFAKSTIGNQFIRSLDSVSANIAEGFGRFNKKDKILFYRIARASAYETLDWLEKSKRRKLIEEKEYKNIFSVLQNLPKEINALMKYTDNNLSI